MRPLVPLSVALGAASIAGWWAPRTDGIAVKVVAYIVAVALALGLLTGDERRWLLRPWTRRAT